MELPPGKREELLSAECRGDEDLRQQLERMLEDGGLDEAKVARSISLLASSFGAAGQLAPGSSVGPYRIEGELGSGGMGVVYLARREDDFFRQVAIKVLRAAVGALEHQLFLRERRILAQLEHPNIARLLDGGTLPGGRPYLVMEYVPGLPLLEFCAARNASIRERLTLFLQVCEAVSAAHRSLVVHRDLKPGNVLVTPEGVPKLLDFGIAKLLPGDLGGAEPTLLPSGWLTPQYASPEQLTGAPVTTATDVYALGLILHELVSGCRAYDLTGLSLAQVLDRVTMEQVTAAPLVRKHGADLERIVLHALAKDPRDRYGSAEQLAEDLRRFLDGRPIRARQGSWVYFAWKLAVRNWAVAAAVAAVVLSLVGMLLQARQSASREAQLRAAAEQERAIAIQAREQMAQSAAEARRQREQAVQQGQAAEREHADAERRFVQVRQLANRFLFDFHDAIQTLPGSTPARQLVVKTALEYLNQLAADRPSDPALVAELATAYERIGDIQGNSYFPHLGDHQGARLSYQRALALRLPLGTADPVRLRDLALSHIKLGDIADQEGQQPEAARQYGLAVALYEASPRNHRMHFDAGSKAYLRRSDLFDKMNRSGPALEDLNHALALIEKLRALRPREPRYLGDLAIVWNKLGNRRFAAGQVDGALEARREGVRFSGLALAAEPRNQLFQRAQMLNQLGLGDLLSNPIAGPHRNLDAAFGHISAGLQLARMILERDPRNIQARTDASFAWSSLAQWHEDREEWPKAVDAHRNAVDLVEELVRRDPLSVEYRRLSALRRKRFGAALAEVPQLEASLAELRSTLAVFEQLAREEPANRDHATSILELYRDIGEVTRLSGDPIGALPHNHHAEQLLRQLIEDDPKNRVWPQHLSPILQQIAKCHQDAALKQSGSAAAGHWRSAMEWWEKARLAGGPFSQRPAVQQGLDRARTELQKTRPQDGVPGPHPFLP
jgi:tetratricopeptide (TPR) repeat protein